MAIPVKTNYLNAIKTALETITQIKKVLRNPPKPYDRETQPFPVCFMFDATDTNTDRNRIQMKGFDLQIEVWIEDQNGEVDIGDMGDIMQAEIHNKLIDNKDILKYGMNLTEISCTKFYADETMGGIILAYRAAYCHKRGDAYDGAGKG